MRDRPDRWLVNPWCAADAPPPPAGLETWLAGAGAAAAAVAAVGGAAHADPDFDPDSGTISFAPSTITFTPSTVNNADAFGSYTDPARLTDGTLGLEVYRGDVGFSTFEQYNSRADLGAGTGNVVDPDFGQTNSTTTGTTVHDGVFDPPDSAVNLQALDDVKALPTAAGSTQTFVPDAGQDQLLAGAVVGTPLTNTGGATTAFTNLDQQLLAGAVQENGSTDSSANSGIDQTVLSVDESPGGSGRDAEGPDQQLLAGAVVGAPLTDTGGATTVFTNLDQQLLAGVVQEHTSTSTTTDDGTVLSVAGSSGGSDPTSPRDAETQGGDVRVPSTEAGGRGGSDQPPGGTTTGGPPNEEPVDPDDTVSDDELIISLVDQEERGGDLPASTGELPVPRTYDTMTDDELSRAADEAIALVGQRDTEDSRVRLGLAAGNLGTVLPAGPESIGEGGALPTGPDATAMLYGEAMETYGKLLDIADGADPQILSRYDYEVILDGSVAVVHTLTATPGDLAAVPSACQGVVAMLCRSGGMPLQAGEEARQEIAAVTGPLLESGDVLRAATEAVRIMGPYTGLEYGNRDGDTPTPEEVVERLVATDGEQNLTPTALPDRRTSAAPGLPDPDDDLNDVFDQPFDDADEWARILGDDTLAEEQFLAATVDRNDQDRTPVPTSPGPASSRQPLDPLELQDMEGAVLRSQPPLTIATATNEQVEQAAGREIEAARNRDLTTERTRLDNLASVTNDILSQGEQDTDVVIGQAIRAQRIVDDIADGSNPRPPSMLDLNTILNSALLADVRALAAGCGDVASIPGACIGLANIQVEAGTRPAQDGERVVQEIIERTRPLRTAGDLIGAAELAVQIVGEGFLDRGTLADNDITPEQVVASMLGTGTGPRTPAGTVRGLAGATTDAERARVATTMQFRAVGTEMLPASADVQLYGAAADGLVNGTTDVRVAPVQGHLGRLVDEAGRNVFGACSAYLGLVSACGGMRPTDAERTITQIQELGQGAPDQRESAQLTGREIDAYRLAANAAFPGGTTNIDGTYVGAEELSRLLDPNALTAGIPSADGSSGGGTVRQTGGGPEPSSRRFLTPQQLIQFEYVDTQEGRELLERISSASAETPTEEHYLRFVDAELRDLRLLNIGGGPVSEARATEEFGDILPLERIQAMTGNGITGPELGCWVLETCVDGVRRASVVGGVEMGEAVSVIPPVHQILEEIERLGCDAIVRCEWLHNHPDTRGVGPYPVLAGRPGLSWDDLRFVESLQQSLLEQGVDVPTAISSITGITGTAVRYELPRGGDLSTTFPTTGEYQLLPGAGLASDQVLLPDVNNNHFWLPTADLANPMNVTIAPQGTETALYEAIEAEASTPATRRFDFASRTQLAAFDRRLEGLAPSPPSGGDTSTGDSGLEGGPTGTTRQVAGAVQPNLESGGLRTTGEAVRSSATPAADMFAVAGGAPAGFIPFEQSRLDDLTLDPGSISFDPGVRIPFRPDGEFDPPPLQDAAFTRTQSPGIATTPSPVTRIVTEPVRIDGRPETVSLPSGLVVPERTVPAPELPDVTATGGRVGAGFYGAVPVSAASSGGSVSGVAAPVGSPGGKRIVLQGSAERGNVPGELIVNGGQVQVNPAEVRNPEAGTVRYLVPRIEGVAYNRTNADPGARINFSGEIGAGSTGTRIVGQDVMTVRTDDRYIPFAGSATTAGSRVVPGGVTLGRHDSNLQLQTVQGEASRVERIDRSTGQVAAVTHTWQAPRGTSHAVVDGGRRVVLTGITAADAPLVTHTVTTTVAPVPATSPALGVNLGASGTSLMTSTSGGGIDPVTSAVQGQLNQVGARLDQGLTRLGQGDVAGAVSTVTGEVLRWRQDIVDSAVGVFGPSANPGDWRATGDSGDTGITGPGGRPTIRVQGNGFVGHYDDSGRLVRAERGSPPTAVDRTRLRADYVGHLIFEKGLATAGGRGGGAFRSGGTVRMVPPQPQRGTTLTQPTRTVPSSSAEWVRQQQLRNGQQPGQVRQGVKSR